MVHTEKSTQRQTESERVRETALPGAFLIGKMCSVMDFSIAPITQAGIPSLLEMILELARFERLEHEVEATIESLQNSLCGPHASACALLAQHGDEPAGYALYFFTFCSFAGRRGLWLDDLYVRPRFRKQGLGRALIQEVASVGARHNCARFEWITLGWNENALNFYRLIGAQVLDDWVLLRMNSDGMKRLAGTSANHKR